MNDERGAAALTLDRLIAAPRAEVFRAWTEPELLARWWWPARFRTTYEVDLRLGGRWRFRTADLPDLGVLAVGGVFLEVRVPERLVYTWVWEGAGEGETLVTVEGRACDEHAQGWNDCLDRLGQTMSAGNTRTP